MANKRAFTMIALSLSMGVAAAWMAGKWIQRAGDAQEVAMGDVVAARSRFRSVRRSKRGI